MNCSWCSIYMKAGVGTHNQRFRFDSDFFPMEELSKQDENKWRFAYLLTPFGWEVGKQKVRGFFEFGFGSNVNLQIGLTYRFGRY